MPFLLAILLPLHPDLVVLTNGSHLSGRIRVVDTQGLLLAAEDGNLHVDWSEISTATRTDGTTLVRPMPGFGRTLAWTPTPSLSSHISDSFEAALRADGPQFLELRSLLASRDLTWTRWRASAEPDAALRSRIRDAVSRGERRLGWEIDFDRARRDFSKKDDALVRRAAAERIARIPIVEAANGLIDALRDPDPQVRAIAARALTDRASAGSVPLIANVLGDPSSSVRLDAQRVMEGWFAKEPELFEELVRRAPSLRAPARAVVWDVLAEKRRGDLEPLIAAAAGHDLDPAARASAIRALGKLGSSERTSVILKAFEHDAWQVRAAAADASGSLGLTEAGDALKRLESDASPTVREAASAARRRLEETASR